MEAPIKCGEAIKKNYPLISDKNKKYLINIENYHYFMILTTFFDDTIKKDEYHKEYKLDELQKIKIFSLMDSIDDIFEEIINLFDKKLSEIKLIEESSKLIINIPLETKKIKDIILFLELKTKSPEEKYDELYNAILQLKKENDILKEEINESKKCPFPIGAVYTQYPNCKEPKELWEKTNWELLNYNGAFFRAVGGKASDFGKLQNEGLPNITGNKLLSWTDYSGGGIIMTESTNVKNSALYSYQDSNYYSFYYQSSLSSKNASHHNILGFNANRTNSIYGNSEHVTPENYAIQIWKRIE